MARHVRHGTEDFLGEGQPVFRKWLDKTAPGFSVRTKGSLGIGEIAFEHDGGSVVEWMGERRGAVNPVQSVIFERKCREKRRAHSKRVNGGAEIVAEAWEGEREGAGRSTGLRFGLENLDAKPSLRENDRGGEAVGARSDDGCLGGRDGRGSAHEFNYAVAEARATGRLRFCRQAAG